RLEHDCWLLEDSGSTNGTYLDAQRVRRVPITSACELRLGHPDTGPAVSCSIARTAPAEPAAGPMGTAVVATPSPGQRADWAAHTPPAPARAPARGMGWDQAPASSLVRQPSAIMQLPTRTLRIGRASDNDVVVSDLSAPLYHAERRKSGRCYEIVALSSHNGTFVNGQWISAAVVTERD